MRTDAQESEDAHRLRTDVCNELEAVMRRHDVGGVVLLVSKESAAWRIVLPKWSALQWDLSVGLRLRASSKQEGDLNRLELAMHLLASLHDLAADVANLMGRTFRMAKNRIEQQGGTVEHVPFSGGHGIDPTGRRGH